MIKIVFFAPYPDILPVIEQVFRERPESEAIRYEVVQDFYNNRLEQVEADVVIARGFTAHTLKRKNIPCAELKSTGYDVMKAVNECMQKGNIERIAVVGAFNMVYGAEQMCHLYPNLGLGCYAEDDETKLEMAVHQAMKDGNQAIVGGYSTVQIAERLGMPAAMIHSGIEAVNHAISEAIAVAHLTRYERQKRDEIANIMNYSFQGIISVNRKGIITLANTCCHTYMKDRKTSLAGEHIKDFFPDIDFDSVINKRSCRRCAGSEENRCWSIVCLWPVTRRSSAACSPSRERNRYRQRRANCASVCIRTALRPGTTFPTYFTGTAAWRRLSARP